MIRSENIKPRTKNLNNYNSNNTIIKPKNINYLGNQLNNQLQNSNSLVSRDVTLEDLQ